MNRNRKISVSGRKIPETSSKPPLPIAKSYKSLKKKSTHKNRVNEQKKTKKQGKKKKQQKDGNQKQQKLSPKTKDKDLNIKGIETKNTHSSTAQQFYLSGAKWLHKRRLTKVQEPKQSQHSPQLVQGKMRQRMITFSSSTEKNKQRKRKSLPCKIIKCSRIPFPIDKRDQAKYEKMQRKIIDEDKPQNYDSQYFPMQESHYIINH